MKSMFISKKQIKNFVIPFSIILGLTFLLSCNASFTKGKNQTSVPISLADSIVMLSQQTLVKTVSQKITENGTPHAIAFCNQKALPLLDSISNLYGVKISRVSEKYRNPLNQPSKMDMVALKELEQGKLKYFQHKGNATYYAPIRMAMPTCLKCHGQELDVDLLTLNKIKEFYPEDKAMNYKLGEFRGAWKVSYSKK